MKKSPINILMLSPIYPFPFQSGSHYFQYNLVKELSHRPEVNLHLLTFAAPYSKRNKEYESLAASTRVVNLVPNRTSSGPYAKGIYLIDYFVTEQMTLALKQTLKKTRVDLVHIEHFQMAAYTEIVADVCPHIPVILGEHDCLGLAERQRRAAAAQEDDHEKIRMEMELARLTEFQKQVYKRFNSVIVFSEDDARTLKMKFGARNSTVIPGSVDTERLRPARNKTNKSTVLFIGTAAHPSTAAALKAALDDIFPRVLKKAPDARLHIAGTGMETMVKNPGPNVEVSGFVPDILDAYHGARVLLAPVYDCAGVRTKILEAMASGVPVVTTPMGNQGINARHGIEALIGKSSSALASNVLMLLRDDALHATIRENALKLVRRRYSRKSIIKLYVELYISLLKQHSN